MRAALDKFIKDNSIYSPIDLHRWMGKNIKYGYTTKQGKVSHSTSSMEKDYVLASPIVLLKNKVGVCWDQVMFEIEIFKMLKIPYDAYFAFLMDVKNTSTHTFVVFYDKDGTHWFENSYRKHRGIHGPFKNRKHLFDEVTSRFSKETKLDAELFYCKLQHVNYGSTANDFMRKHMRAPKLLVVDIDKQ